MAKTNQAELNADMSPKEIYSLLDPLSPQSRFRKVMMDNGISQQSLDNYISGKTTIPPLKKRLFIETAKKVLKK